MELAGAAVLVTGASTGIGAATARSLAGAGARVGLAARRRELLEQVADECREAGSPDVRIWPVDLADIAAAEQLAVGAWQAFGGVDVLVNNAGAPKRRHVTRLAFREVQHIMRLNYLSPVRITLTLLPRMLQRGRGAVVMVASLAGRVGPPREAAYAGSKFALTGFAEVMAVDLADTPIRVRVVQPGPIDTPIWTDLPGNEPPAYTGPRFPPEDCAAAILDAITGEGFERFVPPELAEVVKQKATNIDAFLAGSAEFAKGATPAEVAGPVAAAAPRWVRGRG